ncbi:MAG TPA: T9SS type B sorting domain-containing protein [Bacteroidetes bacterium]|nr:T9SS type B sorting domain-containing protein [Bacteroidota bacterium]
MNQHQLFKTYHHLLCSLAFLFIAHPSFSQLFVEWDKTAGGGGYEELQTLTKTSDGGYLFGGLTNTPNPFPGWEITQSSRDTVRWPYENEGDAWLVKVDGQGQVLWDKRYGGFKQDRIWSVNETADGGFILGGESFSGVDSGTEHTQFNRGELDYWLLKIDKDGNFERDFTFGGPGNDVLRVVIPIENGFMLFGSSDSDNNINSWGEKTDDSRGGADYWIVKATPGLGYWQDWTIGGDGTDWINDVKRLPDGNFIISGWSTSSQGSGEKTTPLYGKNDFWIVKIDGQANILWQMSLGGDEEDLPNDIIITNDGGILLTGFSGSEPASESGIGNKTSPHYGGYDAWVVKIRDEETQGVVEWEQSFGGAAGDLSYSAAETPLGNIMVVGASTSDTSSMAGNKEAPLLGLSDYWVIYLEPDGTKKWDFTMGGINSDVCTKIIRAHDYGFVFGGHSASMNYDPYKSEDSRGNNDMWIVRTGCLIEPPGLQDMTFACDDDLIQIDATLDSCIHCNYFWDDGNTDPVREFAPDNDIKLKLVVQHPDGCEVEDSINIEVIPGIDEIKTGFSPVTCYESNDAEFLVENVEGGIGPFLYRLNGGEWEDFAHYINMAPGEYTLEVLDTNGCTYDTSFFIEQPKEVLLELGDDIRINFGDSVQLQALTNLVEEDSFTFQWAQPQLLSCSDCLNPWVKPSYTTTYSLELKDKNGCAVTDNVQVSMSRSSSVFIPNAFTPNNDNINDFFTIYTDKSVAKVNSFLVYDRWGELMYEQWNFQPNKDQIGWDGRLDGRFMQPAVFAYTAEVEYTDGRTEVFMGNVVLIR